MTRSMAFFHCPGPCLSLLSLHTGLPVTPLWPGAHRAVSVLPCPSAGLPNHVLFRTGAIR